MDTVLLVVCIFSLVVSLVCLFMLIKKKNENTDTKTDEILDRKFSELKKEMNDSFSATRMEIGNTVSKSTETSNKILSEKINSFSEEVDRRLESVRKTTETKLTEIQESNSKKLSDIQNTVDEKLQETLSKRVSESFKVVSEQLENVYKSMGEMQNLAKGVGDLQKVLSNVKQRGIFGEMQLSRILEETMTKDQYYENVSTKKGSADRVEFAVRLPSKTTDGAEVLLPIDAKFPMDRYNALLDSKETGTKEDYEKESKAFEQIIKKNAKDISDKYIDPPHTTDFAIMFLPTESLYAEVASRTLLVETLIRDNGVNIAGPSTITALLNSLQMGFRTLAIEKRSHEVWQILSAVKTEFVTFEKALDGVQKKIQQADKDIESLVGTRTRVMMRKLRDVETLPTETEAENILYGDDGIE